MIDEASPDEQKLTMDDSDFLALVADERKNSIGFDDDEELFQSREQSLQYYKGEMTDIPALPNRSKAVSTDVSDAVETVLPDLIEIFMAGDDPLAFNAVGEEDEEAARQETDYLGHVVFQDNAGFMELYTAFKDALIVKTGVWKFWWNDYEWEENTLKGVDLLHLQKLRADHKDPTQGLEIINEAPGEPDDLGETVNVTIRKRSGGGKACFNAVPPDDFMVAKDTVALKDTTYCSMRSRPRAQDLIAEGYDPEEVAKLPAYSNRTNDELNQARDTAGETDTTTDANVLRSVEVVEHYVRVDADDDGKPEIYKVLAGGNDSVLIHRERVDSIPFAAITPYPVTHRFYGRSLAE